MRVTPRTQEEIDLENLIPDGLYDFEVVKAEDKISKKGREEGLTEPNMIELNLKVFHDDRFSFVKDWILEAMPSKLLHFVNEVGLQNEYAEGAFSASDCLGKCGKVKIVIEEPKGNFDAKNSVKDYGSKAKKDAAKEAAKPDFVKKAQADDEADSDEPIPF